MCPGVIKIDRNVTIMVAKFSEKKCQSKNEEMFAPLNVHRQTQRILDKSVEKVAHVCVWKDQIHVSLLKCRILIKKMF